jgi:hypothetical protein
MAVGKVKVGGPAPTAEMYSGEARVAKKPSIGLPVDPWNPPTSLHRESGGRQDRTPI